MSLPPDYDYLDPDDRISALYSEHAQKVADEVGDKGAEVPARLTPADAVRIARGSTGPPSIPIRFG